MFIQVFIKSYGIHELSSEYIKKLVVRDFYRFSKEADCFFVITSVLYT